MQCPDCQSHWSELYEGALDSAGRRRVEAHFALCPDCATSYEQFRTALDALRSAPLVPASPGFADRVLASVESAESGSGLYEMITSAMPPPARSAARAPRWLALAASVLALFAAALALGLLRAHARLRQEADRVRSLEERVAQVAQEAPRRDEDVSEFLRRSGLVRHQGTYVPVEWKSRMDSGWVLVGGRWLPPEEAAAALGARGPEVAEGEVAARWLSEQGYVEVDGVWVHSDIVRAWQEGLFVAGVRNVWSPEQLEAAFLRRFDIVRDEDGRLWPRDVYLAHREERTVRPDLTRARSPVLFSALDGIEIAPPVRWNDVTIYPLRRTGSGGPALTPLHAVAGDREWVVVEAGPCTLRVRNRTGRSVWIAAGDMFVGGRFDRLAARERVVPAGAEADLPVFDAAPAQYRAGMPAFLPESGHYTAPFSVVAAIAQGADPAEIWARLEDVLGGAGSVMEACAGAYVADALRDLFDLPSEDPRMVGAVFAVRGRVVWAEMYAARESWLANYDRAVAAAALESAAGRPWASAFPDTLEGARTFLENLAAAELVDSQRLEVGRRVAGTVLLSGGEIARIVGFESPRPLTDFDIAQAVARVPSDKVALFVDALRRRLESDDVLVRRQAARELARFGRMQAKTALVGALMDRDPGVVAEALEGLTPPLPAGALEAMAALAQAALPEVRPALVRALGRLPEPRAREVLAALARGAEPAGTAALAAMLPAPGAPADEVRDALVRYVELFEYHEGRRQMEQADSCRRMLERLTGRTFGTAAEARRWWETQGEEFLRARRP